MNRKEFSKKFEIFEEVLDVFGLHLCDKCVSEIAEKLGNIDQVLHEYNEYLKLLNDTTISS